MFTSSLTGQLLVVLIMAVNPQQQEAQVIRIPFIGIPTQRDTGVKDQRYINFIMEPLKNELAQDTRYFLRRRPGLVYNSQPPAGAAVGRGIYSWNNNLYSVFGNKIYKNSTVLSPTLSSSTGGVDFVETSAIAATPYLAMNTGTQLYLIKADDTCTLVVDVDYQATNLGVLVFLDGYIFVATSNGYIWNCALENPVSWDALSYIAAQRFSDNLVAIARQNDVLLGFGQWSTEFFFDAGISAPASPLQRLDQGALQVGCAGAQTIMQHENFIIWVARAQTGGYTVQKLDGITNLRKISDAPLERFLNAEASSLTNAYAYSFRAAGHFFYILTLPTANRSFVYDIENDSWFEWQSGTSGKFDYFYAIQHQGVSYLQHNTNGKLYTVSDSVYLDDTTPIETLIQTYPQDFSTQRRKFYSRFELVGDQQSTNTFMNVSYSDDNYTTYSDPRVVDMSTRAWLGNLGQSRRRAWKITNNSNTPLRLEAYEVEFTFGEF